MSKNNLGRLKKPKHSRVLGVCRTSSMQQQDQSVSEQETTIKKYLERHLGIEKYEIDFLRTTSSVSSTGFKDLYDKIEKENYDVVVTDSITRLSRRLNFLKLLEVFEKNGIRLIAISDQIDSKGPSLTFCRALLNFEKKCVIYK